MTSKLSQTIRAVPIRYKIVIGFLFVLVLITVFTYSYYPAIYKELAVENIRTKDHYTAEQIALSVGIGMEYGDYSIIQSAFTRATADSSILYILLLDNDHNLVADFNSQKYKVDGEQIVTNMTFSEENGDSVHTVRQPVIYNDKTYGMIVLASSMGFVAVTVNRAYSVTLYICLAVFIVGVILSFGIAALITNPLSKLTYVADRVATGNYNVKINLKYYDEVGVLGKAMSNMLNNIRESMERIKELHRKNKSILESAGDGIVGLDNNRVITFINPSAISMLDASGDDLVGKSFPKLVAGSDDESIDRTNNVCSYLTREKLGKTQEATFYTRDNNEIPIELLCTQLDNPDEQSGLVLFFRDITDRKKAQKASEDAAERYRQMFKNIKAVKLLIDKESGYIVDANEAAEKFYGYDFSRLDSIKVSTLYEGFSLDHNTETSNSTLQQHVLANGDTRDVDVHSGPVDISGRRYIYAIVQDVTDQLRAQEELRVERDFTSSIVSTAAALIVVLDKDGRIIRFNKACEQTTKYSSYEVIGRSISDFAGVHDEDNLTDNIGFTELSPNGLPSAFNDVWITKDGEQRVISWNNSNIFNDDGELKYIIATGIDITERLHQEHELRKLSAAVFQSPSIICITSPESVIEYVNPQFVRVTGYSFDDAVGSKVGILKSGTESKDVYKELWSTIKSGGTWSGILKNKKKNGRTFWERKTISPILDDRGGISNYLSVGWDITSELATQQKIAEADKMSAVGMLAAGVAHEFKNYLGGIIGNATFALSTFEDDDGAEIAKDVLEKIVDMGEKANHVAMSLLSYSKGKAAEQSSEDLKLIIQKTIMLVEKELKHVSIQVATYFNEVPKVTCSASRIQQVLLNLIINAQHAIKEDGVITIGLISDENTAYIKVGDTGGGIEEEILQQIFDPFYSTKGVWGKDETVGTGMGLSICRNIAREHQGDLVVTSVKGIGSTFTLSLPLDNTASTITDYEHCSDNSTVIMFTSDTDMFVEYSNSAAHSSIELLLVESIEHLPAKISQQVDMIVCDVQFSGKIELLRVVEHCNQLKLPCVVINGGSREYQLEELYAMVAGHYEGRPDLNEVLRRVKTACLDKTLKS